MKLSALNHKRTMIDGMTIVGIDPAKTKHQAVVIDPHGTQLGSTFSFDVSYEGYTCAFWHKVQRIVPNCNAQNTAVAIETSCNLWLTLAVYLQAEGYRVLLVSPLTTHHSRPMISHDFSRTDPKDALLVASNARQGYFDLYQPDSPFYSGMHRLSITYDKLRKELARNRARLRSTIEQIFPEFLSLLEPDTLTAMYLLKKYLFPQEFLTMDLENEAHAVSTLSRKQHGLNTLTQLQQAAHRSIGVVKKEEECIAERLSLDCWITSIESLSKSLRKINDELVRLAQQLPEYHSLVSLKGISNTSAALFLAELRNIHRFMHYKQIEKFAGANLRLSQSGQFVGTRHISHIGDKRLLWLLFSMTEETAKWIPEVRIKYLTRQLRVRRHRKNVVASIPQLLKLIMALVKKNKTYEVRDEALSTMKKLEEQYALLKKKHPNTKHSSNNNSAAPSQAA